MASAIRDALKFRDNRVLKYPSNNRTSPFHITIDLGFLIGYCWIVVIWCRISGVYFLFINSTQIRDNKTNQPPARTKLSISDHDFEGSPGAEI